MGIKGQYFTIYPAPAKYKLIQNMTLGPVKIISFYMLKYKDIKILLVLY